MKTYYHTKYWEADGIMIFTTDAEPNSDGIITIRGYGRREPSYSLWVGKDTFLTIEEARADVAKRHERAIKSAEKKLSKLRLIDPATIVTKSG